MKLDIFDIKGVMSQGRKYLSMMLSENWEIVQTFVLL